MNTHFGDILIRLDCVYLGTFDPVEDTIAIVKHTQISEYFSYCCLVFLPGGLFPGWLAAVLHIYLTLLNLLIVREPLERLNDAHKGLDVWEFILYVLSLSFIVEGMFLNAHLCLFD